MTLSMRTLGRYVALSLATMPAFVYAEDKVLGRLGQALDATPIYSRATSNSRVYHRTKQYEYLIVRSSTGTYTPVVMENGRLGYIRTSKLAVLPYNVTSAATVPTSGRTTGSSVSRSGSSVSSGSNAKAQIAQYGLRYTGTPYVWGGNSLNNGIDCSGFVQQLFGKIGEKLPRTAAEQAKVGLKIERLEDLQAGDRLYFWDRKRGKIGHTGLYLGNGFFVHSSVNNHGVATDDLRNPKWRNMLVAARR